MSKIDTLTNTLVDRVGIFHDLPNRQVHTFDLDEIENVLNYCLDGNYLGIFGLNQCVSNQKNKWILKHNCKFLTLDLVPENIKYIKNLDRQEYLVFRCPCNKCDEIIFFDDIVERYIDEDSDLYKKLNKKIKTKMIQIYDNIFSRIVYCPNKKCKNSSGIILNEKINKNDLKKLNFICEKCNITWCLNCGATPFHIDEKCGNKLFFNMVEKDKESLKFILQNCMICSICNIPIIKDSGCDHIFCSQCKRSSCWICGEIMPDRGYYSDEEDSNKHIIYDMVKGYICRNTINKNRKEVKIKLRIQNLKKIFGIQITDEICDEYMGNLDGI